MLYNCNNYVTYNKHLFITIKLSPSLISCDVGKRKLFADMTYCAAAWLIHYNDVIMGAIAFQTTSLTVVFSTVYSDADQTKHQSSASLAFLQGIHRGPVNSPHKGAVKRKMFPFNDVIMLFLFVSDRRTIVPKRVCKVAMAPMHEICSASMLIYTRLSTLKPGQTISQTAIAKLYTWMNGIWWFFINKNTAVIQRLCCHQILCHSDFTHLGLVALYFCPVPSPTPKWIE